MSDDSIVEAVKNAPLVAFETEAPKKGKRRARGKSGGGSTGESDATEPGAGGERRLIQFRASKPDVAADEGEEALVASGSPIFHRSGELVTPCVERALAYGGGETHAVTLEPIGEARLIDFLAQAIEFERFDQREEKYIACAPPRILAQILLQRRGAWKFPRVAGVIEHPSMRPDGSLITTPGYDARTQLYLAADPTIVLPEIADHPLWADARQAAELLCEPLVEFPFRDPVLDYSGALSALMTPILRSAMDVAPLHGVSAPTYGVGKSYLPKLASAACTGRPATTFTASGEPEELEKRLDSALLSGKTMIVIDNANFELGGDKLAIAIDQPRIGVRVLGASRTVEIQNQSCLYATGVNLSFRGDVVRRALLITLEPKEERPEERVFARDPFVDILADRGKYIAAALTIARAYLAAGEPEVEHARVVSFGAWSRFVQRPLIWLGYADPAKLIKASEELDSERAAIADVIGAWPADPKKEGFSVNAIVSRANAAKTPNADNPADPDYDLKQTLLCIAGNPDRTVNPLRLSKWLRRHTGRVVDGMRIIRAGEDLKRKSPLWRVASAHE